MKKVIKNAVKILLPLLLGGSILFWIYRDFDFSQVRDIFLYRMEYGWMLLSLLFGIWSHVLRGWRWKLTLAPLNAYPKTSNCVNAVFISYAANLIIPRVGEISRCGILSKYDNVSFSKSLGTVVTERLIDSLCVLTITAVTFILQAGVFRGFFRDTGTNLDSFADIFTSVHFYIILICIIGIIALLVYLINTLSFFEKVKGVALNIWEGILSLRKVNNKTLFFGYTLLIWLCYFLQFYVAFFCFDFTRELGIMAALIMFVMGSIAVIVPTPNGAGPWHFAIITMLVFYGVNRTDAGVFALLVHGFQTFLIILLGIYAWIALEFTNKKSNV